MRACYRRRNLKAVLASALSGGLASVFLPVAALLFAISCSWLQPRDFTLRSADGMVSLRDFRGKVVLLYFGYTYCPDVCPTSLAYITGALRQLSADELPRVQVIFVSVDPERDTPAKLKQYTSHFHPAITGVTGSPTEVAAIATIYGAHYRKNQVNSAAGYLVDHTALTYVIGPSGSLVESLPHGSAPGEIAATIRKHLK